MCAFFSKKKHKQTKTKQNKKMKWTKKDHLLSLENFQRCFQASARNVMNACEGQERERENWLRKTLSQIYITMPKIESRKAKCNSSLKLGINCVGRSEIYTNFYPDPFLIICSLCVECQIDIFFFGEKKLKIRKNLTYQIRNSLKT